MNRIYSNIKKTALSLLVVGLAIGFSASKDAQAKEKASRFAKIYYLLPTGIYSSSQPTNSSCQAGASTPCTLNYTGNPADENFVYADRPTSSHSESANGVYAPN